MFGYISGAAAQIHADRIATDPVRGAHTSQRSVNIEASRFAQSRNGTPHHAKERNMAKSKDRLDDIVREARRNAEQREAGYRAQALKMYPWVCGVCARTFTHTNLQLLEVHHKNGNHDDNPPDGSNWELLCTYCHEHEDVNSQGAAATHNPFAALKDLLAKKTPD
jgi:hypothetical protein